MMERRSQIEAVQTKDRLVITMLDSVMGRPSVLFDSGGAPLPVLLDSRFDLATKLKDVGCSSDHIQRIMLNLAKGGVDTSVGEASF